MSTMHENVLVFIAPLSPFLFRQKRKLLAWCRSSAPFV
jgi:hypothetical protein